VKTAVAIRHLCFEDLGSFAEVLSERGVELRYLQAGVDDLTGLDPLAHDLLLVLGGPIGAYDEADYPFIVQELALLQRRLQAGLATLGICLGAQLMARALGSRVYPGPAKEIGWAPLQLSDAGRASPLRHLDGALTSMLHWHGDTFDLPEGAQLLASTEGCRHQAFSWGDRALAFQCHPEAQWPLLERWYIGHCAELAAAGIAIAPLRAQGLQHGPRLQEQGRRCFAEWLDGLGFLL
jgi:GMP synthase (glutamine-hydrolysing)